MTNPDVETQGPRKPRREAIPVDLNKLAREDQNIHVRNNLDTITVFVLRVNGELEISEFEAKYDDNGGDVLELPASYLKNVNFKKQINLGNLEVIDADDPLIMEAIAAQKLESEARRATAADALNDQHLARQEAQGISGRQCIAPDGKTQCSNYAIKGNIRERPPLCSKHSYLSTQYAPKETGEFTGIDSTEAVVTWIPLRLQNS